MGKLHIEKDQGFKTERTFSKSGRTWNGFCIVAETFESRDSSALTKCPLSEHRRAAAVWPWPERVRLIQGRWQRMRSRRIAVYLVPQPATL